MIRVGWKPVAIVVSVLVVGLISYLMIQSTEEATKDKTTIELQEKQMDKVNETRKKIPKPSSPASDVDVDSILRGWEARRSRQAD